MGTLEEILEEAGYELADAHHSPFVIMFDKRHLMLYIDVNMYA